MSPGGREQTTNTETLLLIQYRRSHLTDGEQANGGRTGRVEPTWRCHGNHSPRCLQETNLEYEERTEKPPQTHTHTHSLCLRLTKKREKRFRMVEQLQLLCHPSLKWLLFWLSK
uniref:Uncharacterized protein n=1 Tax=Gasterosteus aculeatus TaxID=69293 RepID=G3NGF2_GASAC